MASPGKTGRRGEIARDAQGRALIGDSGVKMVPKVGVEPTPGVKPDGILNPARLPVPPLRRLVYLTLFLPRLASLFSTVPGGARLDKQDLSLL